LHQRRRECPDDALEAILIESREIDARHQRVVQQAGSFSVRRVDVDEDVGRIICPRGLAGNQCDDAIANPPVLMIALHDQYRALL
jgi:hypothetical protein